MKEKIESKITEIINYITDKPVSSISKEEYDILSAEYRRIKYEADAKEKSKKLTEMMVETLGYGFNGSP